MKLTTTIGFILNSWFCETYIHSYLVNIFFDEDFENTKSHKVTTSSSYLENKQKEEKIAKVNENLSVPNKLTLPNRDKLHVNPLNIIKFKNDENSKKNEESL